MAETQREPQRPLTVADLIRELQGWIDKDAKFSAYPVMILDMASEESDAVWNRLVTEVEPDMFTEEQGHVMLLSSDPFPIRVPSGR